MAGADTEWSPPRTDLWAAVDARLASLDSGNYRANNRVVLEAFVAYLRDRQDVTDLDELEVIDCRRYAQHLRDRVRDEADDLSTASAHANGPYFTTVRTFLGYVDDERLETNPARPNRVKRALSEHHGDHDRQFWSVEARETLLEFVENGRSTASTGPSMTESERSGIGQW